MNKSVIIDGLRSPIGLKNGKLFNEELGIVTRADDLSADVLKALLNRVGVDKSIYEDFRCPPQYQRINYRYRRNRRENGESVAEPWSQ